ncbi:MAG: selenocysteine-specific translation elongation factor [Verrucomicrobiota bacterium]
MANSRHFILGTAGHIDHGKSSLVQALTGTNPDRLPEEKARGMTIELGFANLVMPTSDDSGDELAIGVIDVPGHADFVKNMVAGVGSIDLALFIIAADDGWMPQTEEHYQILSYLNVPRAIVALTKVDLVDDLELVREDISDHLGGGSWESVPVIPTSAHTGQGIEELREEISKVLTDSPPVTDCGKPRLPVDRVFSPKGVGTVVTGTLTDGEVKTGLELVAQPGGMTANVRNVQSHSANKDEVPPGTRTALNLTGVGVAQRGTEGIARGNVLTLPALGEAVTSIDVLLEKSSREVHGQPKPKSVKTGRQVRFHYGSASFDARAHFLNARLLEPGGTVLAELRFAEPIFVFIGDRFVLRDASLGVTLAGGVVLDEDANRRMFRKPWQETFLETRAANPDDLEILITSQLIRDQAVSKSKLLRKSRFSAEAIGEKVQSLTDSGKLAQSGTWVFDREWWERVSNRAGEMVRKVHQENPELPGLPIRDLRSAVEADLPQKRLFEVILDGLLSGDYAKAGPNIRHRDHLPELPPELQQAGESVRKVLAEDVLQPPNKSEIATSPAEEKALKFLIQVGEAISLDPKTVISAQGYERIKAAVIDHLQNQGKGTASELRQVVGTTRRILMPILERFDAEGITLRQGDYRTLK